jgi:hypothetical protein
MSAACWVHNDSFSPLELIVNPEFLPGCLPGDLISIDFDVLAVSPSTAASATASPAAVKSESYPRQLLLQVAAVDRQELLAQLRQPQLQV